MKPTNPFIVSIILFLIVVALSSSLFVIGHFVNFEIAVISGMSLFFIKTIDELMTLRNKIFDGKEEILKEIKQLKEEIEQLKKK